MIKMKNKTTLTVALIALLTWQSAAQAVPTKWESVELSMSGLINSGWQISAYGNTRVAANNSTSNSFDMSKYSFLLTKNGNYILCIVQDPEPPIARSAGCRKLN
jgi:hypothetical protein